MNQQPQTIAVQYVSDLTYHMIIICAIHAPNTSSDISHEKGYLCPSTLAPLEFCRSQDFSAFCSTVFQSAYEIIWFLLRFLCLILDIFLRRFYHLSFYRYIYQFFHIYRYNMCANITYVHSYIYTYRSVHLSFPHIDSSGKKSPSDMLKDASPCSEVTLARSQRCSEQTTGLTYKETFPVEIWQLGICSKIFHVSFKIFSSSSWTCDIIIHISYISARFFWPQGCQGLQRGKTGPNG